MRNGTILIRSECMGAQTDLKLFISPVQHLARVETRIIVQ